MKKFKKLGILLLVAILALVGCGQKEPQAKKDDPALNKDVNKKEVVIVAGTKTAAELLDALDLDAAGVISTDKALPERFKDSKEIGQPMKPDLELISSLGPDVFITDINLKETMDEMFKESDIELVYLENNQYEDIFKSIGLLAEKFNRQAEGEKLIKKMREEEAEILKEVDGKNVDVLAIFGTPESFMVATPNSFVGSVIDKLSANNIAADLAKGKPMPYLPLSMELISSLQPDKILRMSHVNPDLSKEMFKEEFSKDFWQNLEAVQNKEVYDLTNENFGVTANINIINSLRELRDIIYK